MSCGIEGEGRADDSLKLEGKESVIRVQPVFECPDCRVYGALGSCNFDKANKSSEIIY